MAQNALLEVNDCLPRFKLLNHRGKGIDLLRHAMGRPMVLVLGAAQPGSIGERFLRDLADRSTEWDGRAHVLIFNADGRDANANLAERLGLPFPILSDGEGKLAALVTSEPAGSDNPTSAYARGLCVVVADANCRVLRIDRNIEDAAYLSRLAGYLDGLQSGVSHEIRPAAPVLYIPRVLDKADCRRLIELYETGGNEATGVFRSTGNRSGGTLVPETKIRRDHVVVEPDVAQLTEGLGGVISYSI